MVLGTRVRRVTGAVMAPTLRVQGGAWLGSGVDSGIRVLTRAK